MTSSWGQYPSGVIISGIAHGGGHWETIPEGVELWAINDSWLEDERIPDYATRWFEMHTWERTLRKRSPEHISWLKERHSFPIYMPETTRCVPSSVRYPIEEVRKLVPSMLRGEVAAKDVFGCSFAYMVALAILEKLNPISLTHIRLTGWIEAYLELSSLSFWLGVAAARGHEIYLPKHSAVVPEQLYGYSERYAPGWAYFLDDEVEYVEARKQRPKWRTDGTQTGLVHRGRKRPH